VEQVIEQLKRINREGLKEETAELGSIIEQLEKLDQEHRRMEDEFRRIRTNINSHRENMNMPDLINESHSGLDDVVSSFTNDVAVRLDDAERDRRTVIDELRAIRVHIESQRRKLDMWRSADEPLPGDLALGYVTTFCEDIVGAFILATADAAALRGVVERIRDTARKAEYDDNSDLTDVHRQIYIRDLLGSVAYNAAEGLKEHRSGAALRKDMRQLEAMVNRFEEEMQRTGGWRYGGDRTLAERVQRVFDHYTRMAAQAVNNAQIFKDDMLSWLRGMAINAESVSWGGTHHEKDARLRGLVEVIEAAIKRVNALRVEDRSRFDDGMSDWMRSDFPVREFKRRIYDLEAEVERLRKKAGEEPPVPTEQAEPEF
jgi:hypothetical protein